MTTRSLLLSQSLVGSGAALLVASGYAGHGLMPVAASVSGILAVGAGAVLGGRMRPKVRAAPNVDPLTRLTTRAMASEALTLAVEASEVSRYVGAVIVLGLDGLRSVNGEHGLSVGDMILMEVADRLQAHSSKRDTVARLGGDEFIVVVHPAGGGEGDETLRIAKLADALRRCIAKPVKIDGHDHAVTASVGVALFLGGETKASELLRQASLAMCRAKDLGRNTVVNFDRTLQRSAVDHIAKVNDLRRAMADNGLSLHYQVQVNAQGIPVGAEALLRWRRSNLGFVPPTEFIPIAEASGLIVPIGTWVIQEACKTLQKWSKLERMSEMTLAVNVSPHQFAQVDFVDKVAEILDRHDFPIERLKFEVTEGLLIHDEAAVIDKMLRLREMGVCMSMDDFGTGYSSLSRLQSLPLSQIKIDRSFVGDIAGQGGSAVLVKAIIEMSHGLGLKVIAEGVESPDQFSILRRQGCSIFQGYLFGRPLPSDQFESAVQGSFSNALEKPRDLVRQVA